MVIWFSIYLVVWSEIFSHIVFIYSVVWFGSNGPSSGALAVHEAVVGVSENNKLGTEFFLKVGAFKNSSFLTILSLYFNNKYKLQLYNICIHGDLNPSPLTPCEWEAHALSVRPRCPTTGDRL